MLILCECQAWIKCLNWILFLFPHVAEGYQQYCDYSCKLAHNGHVQYMLYSVFGHTYTAHYVTHQIMFGATVIKQCLTVLNSA